MWSEEILIREANPAESGLDEGVGPAGSVSRGRSVGGGLPSLGGGLGLPSVGGRLAVGTDVGVREIGGRVRSGSPPLTGSGVRASPPLTGSGVRASPNVDGA